jgi:hypothetical protein
MNRARAVAARNTRNAAGGISSQGARFKAHGKAKRRVCVRFQCPGKKIKRFFASPDITQDRESFEFAQDHEPVEWLVEGAQHDMV